MTNKYSAYGLVFESDLDLKPLTPLDPSLPSDVVIRVGSVSEEGIDDPRLDNPRTKIAEEHVWIDIQDVARMLVRKGAEILVDPYPEADNQSISLFVMGSAMGSILHQRGNLVLHANAIRYGEGLVLFAGHSGVGKSTTAATFHQMGYEVISDDVVAINKENMVIGGFPQIKLWHDALEHLDISSENLNRIRLHQNKFSFPLNPEYKERNFPISAIYILNRAEEVNSDLFDTKRLEGIPKFNQLKRHTYRRHFMEGMGLKSSHLKLAAKLADSVPVTRITRPTSRFNALELVDWVLNDLENFI